MGWYFRKSKSLGPFRFTLSKSGLGMSFGVKGARLSFTKRGTYVNLGTGGIYYRKRIDSSKSPSSHPRDTDVFSGSGSESVYSEVITDADSQDFINQLQTRAGMMSLWLVVGLIPCLVGGVFFLSFIHKAIPAKEVFVDVLIINKKVIHVRQAPSKKSSSLGIAREGDKFEILKSGNQGWVEVIYKAEPLTMGFIREDLGIVDRLAKRHTLNRRIDSEPYWRQIGWTGFALAIAWCLYLTRWDRNRKLLKINYTMDGDLKKLHETFLACFREFASSKKVWQNLESNAADKKTNAGAGVLLNRIPVHGIFTHKLPVRHIVTNVLVPCIVCKANELYFFPERIVIKRNGSFGAVMYKNVAVSKKETLFVETSTPEVDAIIDSYTWLYVNKSGGPDRRFSHNKQLPVCIYSEYSLRFDATEVVLSTSRKGAMDSFIRFLTTIGDYQRRLN